MKRYNTNRNFSYLLLVAFFFTFQFSAKAQSELFTIDSWSVDELLGEELDNYNIVADQYPSENLYAVNIFPIEEAQVDGRILISIPWIGCESVLFQAIHVEYTSPSQYSWFGRIVNEDGCECEKGFLSLRNDNGLRNGLFNIDDHHFALTALSADNNVMIEAPASEFELTACGLVELDEDGGGLSPDLEEDSEMRSGGGGNCDVRVLFVYTALADQLIVDETASANTFIDYANQALRNSNVSSGHLNFVMAGVEEIAFDETGVDFGSLPSAVAAEPDAQAFRTLHEADLVYIFVDAMAVSNPTNAIGFANGSVIPGAPSPDPFAYATSNGSPFAAHIGAHELGHLMGAGHEAPDNNSTINDHAHDFEYRKWCLGRKHRAQTIMWSEDDFGDRLQHYSNPLVQFRKKSTGVAGISNNASVMSGNACTVAAYETGAAPFSVRITGSYEICKFNTEVLNAIPSNQPGPYTYNWYVNNTGIAPWGSPVDNGPATWIDAFGYNTGDIIYVKLEATAGNGATATRWHQLTVVEASHSGPVCARSFEEEEVSLSVQEAMKLIPNPASTWCEVILKRQSESRTDLQLVDLSGRVIRKFGSYHVNQNGRKITLDLNEIPNGIYFLRSFYEDGFIQAEKLIVQQ